MEDGARRVASPRVSSPLASFPRASFSSFASLGFVGCFLGFSFFSTGFSSGSGITSSGKLGSAAAFFALTGLAGASCSTGVAGTSCSMGVAGASLDLSNGFRFGRLFCSAIGAGVSGTLFSCLLDRGITRFTSALVFFVIRFFVFGFCRRVGLQLFYGLYLPHGDTLALCLVALPCYACAD